MFATTQATVTVTGTLTSTISSSALRVESVHHALGAIPGMAVISVPGYRPHEMPSTNGNTVVIKLGARTIFSGKVMEMRTADDPGGCEVELVAYDGRADLAAVAVGDPSNADWATVGWDVTFNRNGRPDKALNSVAWARGEKTAEYWSIGDILNYIASKYVAGFSDVAMSQNVFSSATGIDRFPGEIALGGVMVGDAIDMLCSMLGEETWTIGYGSDYVERVSQASLGSGRYIYYSTTGGTPTEWTASSWRVTQNGLRGHNRAVVITPQVETEVTYSTSGLGNGMLRRDTAFTSDIYARRYVPDASKYTAGNGLGPARSATAHGLEWLPALATRRNAAGTGYLTAAQHQAAADLGDPVADREVVWISDDEATWYRLRSGYEIEYDPPGIYLEATVTVEDAEGAETEIQIDADATIDLRLTMLTRTDTNLYSADAGTVVYNNSRTRYHYLDGMVPRYRNAVTLPNLASSDPTAVVSATAGYWDDYADALVYLADEAQKREKLVHREMIATLEVPQYMALGDRIYFTPLSGSSAVMGSDPIICTGLDWYFGDAQRLVVRGENQLGAAYLGLRPSAERATLDFRFRQRMERLGEQFRAAQAAKRAAAEGIRGDV